MPALWVPLQKDEDGHARIDFDKCISCGKCVSSCPFGAVHKKVK